MMKKTDNIQSWQELPEDSEVDALFDELQAVWDRQNRRIDQIIAETDSQQSTPLPPPPARSSSGIRLLALYVFLSVVLMATAIRWALIIPPLLPTTLTLIVGLAVEAVFLLALAECLYRTCGIIARDPARDGILRMSRLNRWGFLSSDFFTAGFAAILILVSVSIVPLGDGLALTKHDRVERAAVYSNVEETLLMI